MNDAIGMQLSAYVDGELPENEAELLLRRVSQDVELRQQVAEYFAMSRLLRSERGIAAADHLYERVAAEIDERPAAEMGTNGDAPVARAVRPLAGIAIAASVASLAIFGLQQLDSSGDSASVTPNVANSSVPDIGQPTNQNRQFFLNHANASSRLGANGMNSRLVALRFSEEVADESDSEDSIDIESAEKNIADQPTDKSAGEVRQP